MGGIPNVTIIFSSFSSKDTQQDIFGLKFKDFFVFAQNFKLTTQYYTNKVFLVPKLKLFVLYNFPFYKFECADFKYENLFEDFNLKISRKEHFLSQS